MTRQGTKDQLDSTAKIQALDNWLHKKLLITLVSNMSENMQGVSEKRRFGPECDEYSNIFISKTSQELRMLSSATINFQVTKIVINPGSQLSVL